MIQAKYDSIVFLFCTIALVSTHKFSLKLYEILGLVKIPVNFNHNGNDHNTVPLETASYLKYDWLCLTCTMWDKLVPKAAEDSNQDDTLQVFYKQSSPEDHRLTDTILYLRPPTWNITAGRRPAINCFHFPYIFGHLQAPFFFNCFCQPSFSWTCFPLPVYVTYRASPVLYEVEQMLVSSVLNWTHIPG